MTSLIQRDASGILQTRESETENLRTRNCKRWFIETLPDGRKRYRVGASLGPIHYKSDPFSDGPWEEIDLNVVLTPDEPWDAACESNGYQVRFWQSIVRGNKTYRYVAQFRRAGHWLAMSPIALVWENTAGQRQLISRIKAVGAPTIDNEANYVQWDDAFGTGLHYRYNLTPDKFFKSLVIENKSSLPAPTIGTNGLKLTLVLALEWDFGASARNGLSDSIETSLGDDDTGTVDESLDDPDVYDHHDVRGSLWWVQKPRAWDSAEEQHSVPVEWRIRRKGGNVYGLFSVLVASLNNAATVYPVYVDTAITEEVVPSGAYDAQQYQDGTHFDKDGPNVIFNWTNENEGLYTAEVIFSSVPIPQSATINSAALLSWFAAYDDPAVDLYCEDTDSAVDFTSNASITNRDRTTASVVWEDSNLGTTTWVESPDLSQPVQEVVDRAGWSSDNNLGVIARSRSFAASALVYSVEHGYDRQAKFNCDYTEAAVVVTEVTLDLYRPIDYGDLVGTLEATGGTAPYTWTHISETLES